jgi:hypothetical protein
MHVSGKESVFWFAFGKGKGRGVFEIAGMGLFGVVVSSM